MFINEKLVYLAFLKTGCTHVLNLLSSIPELNGQLIGKHNSIYDIPANELGNPSHKIKSGNIRNPWDWYVSLWAFGCMGKGGLLKNTSEKNIFRRIKHPKTFFAPAKEWQEVYADAEDPKLFRSWLKMLLCTRRHDIPYFRDTATVIGYMSYKYLELYTYDFKRSIKAIKNFEELNEFDRQKNFIDFFIASENLENDFKSLMDKLGVGENAVNGLLKTPKTNSSIRHHYGDYYDEYSIELVREKDKLIIQKHNYTF